MVRVAGFEPTASWSRISVGKFMCRFRLRLLHFFPNLETVGSSPLRCFRLLISYCGSSCGSGYKRGTHIGERKSQPNRPLPLIGDTGNLLNEPPLFLIRTGTSHTVLSAHLKKCLEKPFLLRVPTAVQLSSCQGFLSAEGRDINRRFLRYPSPPNEALFALFSI